MYLKEQKENRMNQTTKKTRLERTDIQDIHALSPVQEGMLYHYRQAPTSQNYHEQLILDLEGEINARDVEAAWNDVIDANEMLRVRLRWEKLKEPVQVILKEHRLKVRHHDITGDSEKQDRLDRICREDRRKPMPRHLRFCKQADRDNSDQATLSSHQTTARCLL